MSNTSALSPTATTSDAKPEQWNAVPAPRSTMPTHGGEACAEPVQQILGTWKMVSWMIEDLATGQTRDALGGDPQGYIIYTRAGRVMVFIVGRERMKPAALIPTNEEKIALYDTMFAYAGTFTIDGNKVVHDIDLSWNESWRGTSQIRFYELRGDVLTYVSAPAKSPMTGCDCVHTVVFRRVEQAPAY